MKTILLVIGDAEERERIRAALGERGHWVTAVDDRRGALRAAADQAPDLVLVSSEVSGAAEVVKSFGSRNGGPGALLLAPPDRTEDAFVIYEAGADRILSQPVRIRDLVDAVEQSLAAPRDAFAPAPAAPGRMFTAQEIFGDVLAEVERAGEEEPPEAAESAAPGPAAEVEKAEEARGVEAAGEIEAAKQLEERAPSAAPPAPVRSEPSVPPPSASPPAAAPPQPAPSARPVPPAAPSGPPPEPPGAETAGAAEAPAAETAAPGAEPGRFGQYQLVERIAVGGMAEVWKARMSGVEGFRKTVAIKKILPHLAESRDFVTMFIDEAKLAAELSHENIVHIYDLGKIGQDYFIAMEYVDGRDLRSILNAARERGARLPFGLSLRIAGRLASALDHAHRRRSGNGVLGLVHRDVSPRNVLVGREGVVKLCDFGVAKAASTVARTQVGVLKGKLEYMSPEQASGGAVDARSDVFSLGALLFEMLTGEPLFSGEGEVALLETVRACRVRAPRAVDPEIPREVDRIVQRALRKDPAKRFPGAGEMQRELEAALRQLGLAPETGDLARWVDELFAAPVPAAPAEESRAGTASAAVREEPAPEADGRRRRRWIAAAVAALAVLALGLVAMGLLRDAPSVEEPETETAVAAPAPAPPAAEVEPQPTPPPLDVEAIVDRELERREAELREAFLEEERRLQRELERLESEAGRDGGAPPP